MRVQFQVWAIVLGFLNARKALAAAAPRACFVCSGRSIAKWLASRGAKGLIFLSPSGAPSCTAQSLVKELKAANCRTHNLPCDVTDKAALFERHRNLEGYLAPINGCSKVRLWIGGLETIAEEYRDAFRPCVLCVDSPESWWQGFGRAPSLCEGWCGLILPLPDLCLLSQTNMRLW